MAAISGTPATVASEMVKSISDQFAGHRTNASGSIALAQVVATLAMSEALEHVAQAIKRRTEA